jgi:hypothetical protein
MVIQFVTYSSGDMSISEKRKMPQGWEKKYWDVFPQEVRVLIASYLKGNINKKDFWNRVSKAVSL